MATKPGLSALAERAAELERANDTAIASVMGPGAIEALVNQATSAECCAAQRLCVQMFFFCVRLMCCACSARACEVCACITHVRTCECECTPDVHARKAYGPWRACVSIVCDIVSACACECECARAQFSCARVHVRVFELTRTCVVCVCAVLHCTVLVCTVLCNTGASFVHAACAARALRA